MSHSPFRGKSLSPVIETRQKRKKEKEKENSLRKNKNVRA
jgi:hypothetical protein